MEKYEKNSQKISQNVHIYFLKHQLNEFALFVIVQYKTAPANIFFT